MAHQTESHGPGSGPALAVLATAPRPGLVLVAACPPLRAAEAAGLQTAWLKQIVQELPGVAVYLCGRPADAAPMLRYFAGPGVELRAWHDTHRGPMTRDVLARAAAELFAAGHAPVLVRTADTPDVDPAALSTCLDAARQGACVLGRDQRGAAWLLAAPAAAALATATPQPGPWARSVQHLDDLDLLWQERLGPDRAAPPTLPVHDLQASLRFYEVVFGAALLANDGELATIEGPALRVRLAARGPSPVANGLLLPCTDAAALAAALAPHRVVAAGDELAPRIGGGRAVTATDPDGHRLCFVEAGFAP